MQQDYFFNSTTWQYLSKEEFEKANVQTQLAKIIELLSKKK